MTNNLNGKDFYVHAKALDNRAILRITDKRTMQTQEFEVEFDGKRPYFIDEQPTAQAELVEPIDDTEEE